jgi:hypothetical protein
MNSVFFNPVKILEVSGSLTKDHYTIKSEIAFDYCDIRIGNWYIAVRDITTVSPFGSQAYYSFVNITTNLVTGLKIDANHRKVPFEPALQRCKISTYADQLQTFDLQWFGVNSQSSFIDVNFEFWPDLIPFPEALEMKIYLTLMLVRFQ